VFNAALTGLLASGHFTAPEDDDNFVRLKFLYNDDDEAIAAAVGVAMHVANDAEDFESWLPA
jgi:hypothetical protein